MRMRLLVFGALAGFLWGDMGAVVAATAFDDPNVKAMHDMVNNLPSRAESGDPQAQTDMGMISLYGFNGSQDLVSAKKWFQKAADQGYPEAMVQLGNLYENGLGGENDPAKAMDLYKKSSDVNYAPGRFRLGMLYLGGIGVSKNEEEGGKLLRSACDNGYRTSCGMLLWQENKISVARVEFNSQCQSGDQVACGFLKQLGPDAGDSKSAVATEQGQNGKMWISLAIGLVLVGLLIFWLVRNDDEEEGGKGV